MAPATELQWQQRYESQRDIFAHVFAKLSLDVARERRGARINLIGGVTVGVVVTLIAEALYGAL